MLKFRSGDRVFLGLSNGNIVRLQQDEPIRVSAEETAALLGPLVNEPLELVIFAGEDEVKMTRELEDRGIVPPGTTAATEGAFREHERRKRER